ncbi:V(D)J recombination-activating protein 1-like [Oppia nitens]|uniref:V(D)J recombination-activating protein 1-like n=1 Tax=Oppia nitens TaxID=1686743 RepID=UPI0023DBF45C|nr:V(D)J recombination-activating protein 1-like [Oppia nitens]
MTERVIDKEDEAVYRNLLSSDLFMDAISDEYKCSICLTILQDPVCLPCPAQHMFCRLCITGYFQHLSAGTAKSCPVDRMVCTMADIRPAHPSIKSIIEKFKMRCPNHEDGCTVTITVSELRNHTLNCRLGPCTGGQPSTSGSDVVGIEVAATPITIYVKLEGNKTAIISADEKDNVLTLRRRIREKEGIDTQSLIITNGTKPLAEDSRLLIEYNIKNGSVLYTQRRFNGGLNGGQK